MTALVAVGVLAAGVAPSLAAEGLEDPRLQELWKRFPLDAERAAPSRPLGSLDGAREDAPAGRRVSAVAEAPVLGDEDTQSNIGRVLSILGVLFVLVAAMPRRVIPDERVGTLLATRRPEVVAVGVSLFLGVSLVLGLG